MNTYAEIDLEAIKHNINEVKKIIPDKTRFMAVVKANAYGHGVVAVSRAAMEAGVFYLAVANLREALELREAGTRLPILILTESPTSVVDEIVHYRLTQTVYSFSEAKALSDESVKRDRKSNIHIKIDTGMGRVGVAPSEAVALYNKISSLPNLIVEGLFTHFAKAEEHGDNYTKEQFDKFKNIIIRFNNIPIKHAANSAATLFHPDTHLDMVRIGLMMYGLYPSGGTHRFITLRPALSFKTRIVYLKRVPEGTMLSYGGTYVTSKETAIATIPVGYADGYSRSLSNRSHVLIRGKRCPVVGSISMDMTLVDVGDMNVEIGEDVVLIGAQGLESITADEIARLDRTISYEIICGIGKRVPRIYR
ncbi:alanine racemase [candidate division WOR-1 bacterium RIFOXYD2_FULL_36_8]|uniref:Alanine racemase n=1 Tax=candidate division WOR-1 bacterium RIFOXYB2_FULL_36_35 TaxID=1802578 RepID=A0A1F4S185_UNCSA|nr:MAG: alanine racemase [candidate division WOR-1 bacterium RIFOXYA2_FULL_36_21]OGC14157.1 MAG: alanine racemase [candidate division WOR-1 bacterium RIFOXYB2_FULL_36_35]OGC15379.1 MAG: alanine racemase [candidate division WOR-1 bacterium RIFOXYA12_FULL_36_13]OGC40080.1 MAG: alanine racemase [candidate division WOR-1 bacterium RIFOXYD2_FULL_36_8]